MELVVTTGAISRAKIQSNRHHQQTNTQLFTVRMPFLSPNQQCQTTERSFFIIDNITSKLSGVAVSFSLEVLRHFVLIFFYSCRIIHWLCWKERMLRMETFWYHSGKCPLDECCYCCCCYCCCSTSSSFFIIVVVVAVVVWQSNVFIHNKCQDLYLSSSILANFTDLLFCYRQCVCSQYA